MIQEQNPLHVKVANPGALLGHYFFTQEIDEDYLDQRQNVGLLDDENIKAV